MTSLFGDRDGGKQCLPVRMSVETRHLFHLHATPVGNEGMKGINKLLRLYFFLFCVSPKHAARQDGLRSFEENETDRILIDVRMRAT